MGTKRTPRHRGYLRPVVMTAEARAAWLACKVARPGTDEHRDAELRLQRACGLSKFGPYVLTGAPSLIGADETAPLAKAWRVALEAADREAAAE
jgi:hypothetical protein